MRDTGGGARYTPSRADRWEEAEGGPRSYARADHGGGERAMICVFRQG